MPPEIRQIREEDIESFRETLGVVARERRYLAMLDAPTLERSQAFCRQHIANGTPQLVVVSEGKVVGWCDITPPGREVFAHVGVLGMGLLPEWRGRGLGERLMRAALAAADVYGFTRIELGVFSHNTRAQALYRKLGFVEEGVKRRRILIDGVHYDEIMMARLRDALA